jgi:hypothetical protein
VSARASLIPRACLAAVAAREHTARLVACAGGRAPVAERTRSRYTELAVGGRPKATHAHSHAHTHARVCAKLFCSRAPRTMPTRSHERSQRHLLIVVTSSSLQRHSLQQSMSIKSRMVRTVSGWVSMLFFASPTPGHPHMSSTSIIVRARPAPARAARAPERDRYIYSELFYPVSALLLSISLCSLVARFARIRGWERRTILPRFLCVCVCFIYNVKPLVL